MRYRPEWKKRLLMRGGEVYWDGVLVDKIQFVRRDGARSPGGMVTDTVFVTQGREFASCTLAIEHLLEGKA